MHMQWGTGLFLLGILRHLVLDAHDELKWICSCVTGSRMTYWRRFHTPRWLGWMRHSSSVCRLFLRSVPLRNKTLTPKKKAVSKSGWRLCPLPMGRESPADESGNGCWNGCWGRSETWRTQREPGEPERLEEKWDLIACNKWGGNPCRGGVARRPTVSRFALPRSRRNVTEQDTVRLRAAHGHWAGRQQSK